jgi:hypothetical protein
LVLGGSLVFVLHGAPPRRGKRSTDVPGGTPLVGAGGRRAADRGLDVAVATPSPAPVATPSVVAAVAPVATTHPSVAPAVGPRAADGVADESPNDWYRRLAATGEAPRR